MEGENKAKKSVKGVNLAYHGRGENIIFEGGVGVWFSDRYITPDIGEGIYDDFVFVFLRFCPV